MNIPTTVTYVDDDSSCCSTPPNAFTYKHEARDDGETHEPPPPPTSPFDPLIPFHGSGESVGRTDRPWSVGLS